MKKLVSLSLEISQVEKELSEYKELLDNNKDLLEQKVVLPFFKERLHLSALIGSIHGGIAANVKYAHEFSLIGDNTCDLVTYSECNNSISFIEFEDALSNSVFKQNSKKSELDWSPRFEHGFSQIVDWFFKLDDLKKTNKIKSLLGDSNLTHHGMLVIGRDNYLNDESLRFRLHWRSTNVIINSVPILCLTYDSLYLQLKLRIDSLKALSNYR